MDESQFPKAGKNEHAIERLHLFQYKYLNQVNLNFQT